MDNEYGLKFKMTEKPVKGFYKAPCILTDCKVMGFFSLKLPLCHTKPKSHAAQLGSPPTQTNGQSYCWSCVVL